MIYLASPYSHKVGFVRSARAASAGIIVAGAITRGVFYYSPIAMGHYVEMSYKFELPWESWMAHGLSAIDKCKEVVVLQIPGWDKSSGVQKEMEYAKDRGFPIDFFPESDAKKLIPQHLWQIMKEAVVAKS